MNTGVRSLTLTKMLMKRSMLHNNTSICFHELHKCMYEGSKVIHTFVDNHRISEQP